MENVSVIIHTQKNFSATKFTPLFEVTGTLSNGTRTYFKFFKSRVIVLFLMYRYLLPEG